MTAQKTAATTEAQAYREGWQHCLAGNDIRWGNPYRNDSRLGYAFDHGALDCMEREDDNDTCEPARVGYHEESAT
jgi:hypothetical protein